MADASSGAGVGVGGISGRRIVLATLRERTALWEFCDSRDRLERSLRQAGCEILRYQIGATYLSRGRNQAVSAFLKDSWEPDILWFVDSDVVLPDGAGPRLLRWERPVVSGLYFKRHPPYLPEVYSLREDGLYQPMVSTFAALFEKYGVGPAPGLISPAQGLLSVDGVGAGCLVLQREVLEALGAAPFGPTETGLGEDLWFCRRVKEAGYSVFVDWGVVCGHLHVATVGPEDFLRSIGRV